MADDNGSPSRKEESPLSTLLPSSPPLLPFPLLADHSGRGAEEASTVVVVAAGDAVDAELGPSTLLLLLLLLPIPSPRLEEDEDSLDAAKVVVACFAAEEMAVLDARHSRSPVCGGFHVAHKQKAAVT